MAQRLKKPSGTPCNRFPMDRHVVMDRLPKRSDSLKNPARSERRTVPTRYRSLCRAIESLVQTVRLSGTGEDYGGKNGSWITSDGTPGDHSNTSRIAVHSTA